MLYLWQCIIIFLNPLEQTDWWKSATNWITYRLEFPCGQGRRRIVNNMDDLPTLSRVLTKGILDEVEGALDFKRNIFPHDWPYHLTCDFSKSRLQLDSLNNYDHLQESLYSYHFVSIWQWNLQEIGEMELLKKTARGKEENLFAISVQLVSTYCESE